ncbi:MAG: uroporphyrinogen decarboxylase family protein [Eubacteriales bacterium]
MTSRERLLNALNGLPVDRTPVTLFIQEQGHFIVQINPDEHPEEFTKNNKFIADYMRKLGLDVHVRMLFFNPHEPNYFHQNLLNFHVETPDWQIKSTVTEKEDATYTLQEITTPKGVLTQEFTVCELTPKTFVYACTKKPINGMADLEIAMEYEPPIAPEQAEKIKLNTQELKDYIGDDGIVSAWSNGGLFNNVSGLIDHTQLYTLFLTDPDYYKALMTFAKKRVYAFTDVLIDAGMDAICFGGNVAGGFLGGPMFETYIMPYEREYAAYIHSRGVATVYHNCGQIMNLVPAYQKMGVKNVEPFSPVPLGDGDLDKVAEVLNGEFSVTGGIDQVNVIQAGTVADVEKAVEETLEKAKKIPNFILQSADFLSWETPLENVEAFARKALEIVNKQ